MKTKLVTDKGYFLGITKDNEKVYLEKPSWDCGWYWGFGYLEFYSNRGRPTHTCHTHWDVITQSTNAFDAIKEKFTKFSLSDNKLWKLCDYMKSFYTLKEAAALYGSGHSHYTRTDIDLSDKDKADEINKITLPKLFEQIDLLFTGDEA